MEEVAHIRYHLLIYMTLGYYPDLWLGEYSGLRRRQYTTEQEERKWITLVWHVVILHKRRIPWQSMETNLELPVSVGNGVTTEPSGRTRSSIKNRTIKEDLWKDAHLWEFRRWRLYKIPNLQRRWKFLTYRECSWRTYLLFWGWRQRARPLKGWWEFHLLD